MKQYVKALKTESKSFKYLRDEFPNFSKAKLKEGIIVGLDIQKLMKHDQFVATMTPKEKMLGQVSKVSQKLSEIRLPDSRLGFQKFPFQKIC